MDFINKIDIFLNMGKSDENKVISFENVKKINSDNNHDHLEENDQHKNDEENNEQENVQDTNSSFEFEEARKLSKSNSLEESFWSFYVNYKSHIFKLAVITLVIFLGVQGFYAYKNFSMKKVQKLYSLAKTSEEKLKFAENNRSNQLAGLIFLENADELYSKKDYEKARVFYKNAQESLDKQFLNPRAKIGEAVSMIYLGQEMQAIPILKEIYNNKDSLNFFRAQSLYFIALIHHKKNNLKTAQKFLDRMQSLDYKGIFVQKANDLRELIKK